MNHKFILGLGLLLVVFFFSLDCVNIRQIFWRKVSLCCGHNLFFPATLIVGMCLRRHLFTTINSSIIKNKNMHLRLAFVTRRISRVSCRNVYCSYGVRVISFHELICAMKTKGHCWRNFPFQNPLVWNVRSRWVGACNSHTKSMSRHFYRLIYF